MTSPLSFFNGFVILIMVILAWFVVFLHVYYYFGKERNPRHLSIILLALAIGFGWSGILISFCSILIHGINVTGIRWIIPLFSYSTIPIGGFAVLLLVWEIAGTSKNQKKILKTYGMFCLLYYIALYSTIKASVGFYPELSGQSELLDDWILPTSPVYYLIWGAVIIPAIPAAMVFNKIRKMTSGSLEKKSMVLIFSTLAIGTGILLDTVILMGDAVQYVIFVPRILCTVGSLSGALYGFKPRKGT